MRAACRRSQGQTIQSSSSKFFANGSHPGGVLTAPGKISPETADRLKSYWETNFSGVNAGRVAILGDGLKYEGMTVNAVDSQLIDQLKWTADTVCSCYHVPAVHDRRRAAAAVRERRALAPAVLHAVHSVACWHPSKRCWIAGSSSRARPSAPSSTSPICCGWTRRRARKPRPMRSSGAAMSPNEARFRYFGLGKVAGGDSSVGATAILSVSPPWRSATRPIRSVKPSRPPRRMMRTRTNPTTTSSRMSRTTRTRTRRSESYLTTEVLRVVDRDHFTARYERFAAGGSADGARR